MCLLLRSQGYEKQESKLGSRTVEPRSPQAQGSSGDHAVQAGPGQGVPVAWPEAEEHTWGCQGEALEQYNGKQRADEQPRLCHPQLWAPGRPPSPEAQPMQSLLSETEGFCCLPCTKGPSRQVQG